MLHLDHLVKTLKFFGDIKELRKKIFVPIALGGGIRKIRNAKECFDNGADKI